MSSFYYIFQIKFAFLSAIPFYLAIWTALIFPQFRAWLYRTISLPNPSTISHLDPLDAFRAFAALWVACGHLYQWPWPTFAASAAIIPNPQFTKAVPVFCVLSGMLIYRSLTRSKGQRAVLKDKTFEDLRQYALRRVLRIYPLYAFCIFFAFLMFNPPAGISSIVRLIYELFGLHAFALQAPILLPTTWSLYIEFLFYAVIPIYVVASYHRPIMAAICAVLILTVTDPLMVAGATNPFNFIIVASIGLWKFFAFGVLASELYDLIRKRGWEWIGAPLLLIGLPIFVESFYADRFTSILNRFLAFVGESPIGQSAFSFDLGLGVLCLVLGALFFRPANRLMSSAPLRMLGAISYTIFMIHGFVIFFGLGLVPDWNSAFNIVALPAPAPAWVPFLVFVPAIISWAAIVFLIVEKPFLNLRRRETDLPLNISSTGS